MSFDIANIRADFPILARNVNGETLTYLDNGASAQKPQIVIDEITRAYAGEYANVHRGLHYLSNLATEKFEATRETIGRFLNVPASSIVYTTGSTEAINLVSYAWAAPQLQAGDEIVLSVMEHHANIVPWHFLRERQGVVLKWVDVDDDGALPPERVIDAVSEKTKLIALSHMSNVTGCMVDIATIAAEARARGIPILVDGSQAAVHENVDVAALGVDFYAITGHKLYGPTGSGALYIHPDRMKDMRPFMGGGDMIEFVEQDRVTYASGHARFEAGTPGIVEMTAFGTALEYLMSIGMDSIAAYEDELRHYTQNALQSLDFLDLQGNAKERGGIFSFTFKGGGHAHDISTIVDQKGVALRAGTHCAQPLMARFGVSATCRASFAMYNTKEDTDRLVDALKLAHRLLG